MHKPQTPMPDSIRVLIVDDHPAMREGLGLWIHRQKDMKLVGEAGDANSAMNLLYQTEPNVVVVDLSLKESDGMDLIRRIMAQNSNANVLVCSMQPEIPYAKRSMKLGAKGFIGKSSTSDEIIGAIRTVAQGHRFTSQSLRDRLVNEMFSPGKPKNSQWNDIDDLSDRELQVFEHIGRGLTIIEIAQRLNLSSHTVETYRQRIRKKLNFRTISELASKAAQWVLEHDTI